LKSSNPVFPDTVLKNISKRRKPMTFPCRRFANLVLLPIVIAVSLFFLPLLSSAADTLKATESIILDSGKIIGRIIPGIPEVSVFKGIPYAAPPVGALRWKPPQPVIPWEGIRPAHDFSAVCPQPGGRTRLTQTNFDKINEDCLYLNIWTPARDAKAGLPVMVWIHGGGNISGASSLPYYDGTALARQGVILVSINYRLGPLGFFAHPLLSKESPQGVSGNYGLLDQIAALKWVQKNISTFGGDPGRVTIFGESAGGLNVCCLMASPLAKGLFHRAIAQSGHAFGRTRHLKEPWYKLEPMEKQGERIAAALGVQDATDPLAALRALSPEKILEISKPSIGIGGEGGNRFGPVTDGWVIPDDINTLFEKGLQNDVPLIVGSNASEGTIFMLNTPIKTVNQLQAAARALYGKYAEEVLSLYPAKDDSEVRRVLSDVTGDFGFVAGARLFARSMQSVKSRAYLYHFTKKPKGSLGETMGAFHGSEIPYVFNHLEKGISPPDAERQALAKMMSGYWVQFAKTGDPNHPGAPLWPVYATQSDQHLEFGDIIQVGKGLRKTACDLAEKILTEDRKNR
jgi:para-nitrobenzyl esterase